MLILLSIVMIATLVKGDLVDSPAPQSMETSGKGIENYIHINFESIKPKITLRYCYFEKLPRFLFAVNDVFYFNIAVALTENETHSYAVSPFALMIGVRKIEDIYASIQKSTDMSRYYRINCVCFFHPPTKKEECIATKDVRFYDDIADVLGLHTKPLPVETNTRNGTMAHNIYADMEYLIDLLGVPCEYQAFSAAALAWVLACASLAFVLFLLIGICKHSTYQPADTPKKK
jgi:hypothetical protein